MLHEELLELAIGDEVPVPVETHSHADRRGEAVVVWRALDAETYQAYDRLSGGLDGRSGDPQLAARYLAARKGARIEGMRLPTDFARFGTYERWFALSDAGLALAEATIPGYLEASLPTQEEVDGVELAAYYLIEHGEGKNPYQYGSHRPDCQRDLWENRDEERLRELASLKEDGEEGGELCPGCLGDRRLFARVLKEQGTARWLDVARRALSTGRYLEQFPAAGRTVSAREWLFVETARAEVDKRRVYNEWKAVEEAKATSGSGGATP